MSDEITLNVRLPRVVSGDVKKLVLTVSRDPAGPFDSPEVIEMTPDQTSVPIEAVQDAHVGLHLVAVDDAGNESKPVLASVQATESIPPQLAGELTIGRFRDGGSETEQPTGDQVASATGSSSEKTEPPVVDDENPGGNNSADEDDNEHAEQPVPEQGNPNAESEEVAENVTG